MSEYSSITSHNELILNLTIINIAADDFTLKWSNIKMLKDLLDLLI
jgi:hypothetical protein